MKLKNISEIESWGQSALFFICTKPFFNLQNGPFVKQINGLKLDVVVLGDTVCLMNMYLNDSGTFSLSLVRQSLTM